MKPEEIFKKLRLDFSKNILIVNAPENYSYILTGVNYDKQLIKLKEGKYDFVQFFATSQSELEKLTKQVSKAGKYDCLFWACYPKGTGLIKSDIKRDTVWNAFELIGLQAVSQIAIDDTWSALRARPKNAVGK
jgi:hypothetical protein